jgi:hypothetical protein
MAPERRGCVVQPWPSANWKREEPVDEVKPFDIPKREVWEAFKKVKANQGAAGVDGQSILDFEADLTNNLYELWNRLSSGSRARQRCWRYDWVLDLDVKAYFDSIDWELMLRTVRRHMNRPWVLLYIERWLMEDGSIVPRMSGTPQGRGHKPPPGESVSALCVRHVDGEKVSAHPVRALRG